MMMVMMIMTKMLYDIGEGIQICGWTHESTEKSYDEGICLVLMKLGVLRFQFSEICELV